MEHPAGPASHLIADVAIRQTALRAGVRLESFTVAWMALEAALAIGAGIAARSILLTAFGVDSLIELLSGATLLWRLRAEAQGGDQGKVDRVERIATRLSAALLAALCAYVLLSSVAGLLLRVQPERSWLGVTVSVAAVVIMPWLANRKRLLNRMIQSSALRADIAESVTCAYLAGITLAGVAINAVTGWSWVEYIAAILLLLWLIPEAREALEAARESET